MARKPKKWEVICAENPTGERDWHAIIAIPTERSIETPYVSINHARSSKTAIRLARIVADALNAAEAKP